MFSRQRHRLRQCGILYSINPDNTLLALFGRFCCGRKLPLVVEIADIQPAMTRKGRGGGPSPPLDGTICAQTKSFIINNFPRFFTPLL